MSILIFIAIFDMLGFQLTKVREPRGGGGGEGEATRYFCIIGTVIRWLLLLLLILPSSDWPPSRCHREN